MKTKEEILKNTHSFLDDTMGRCYELDEALTAMQEYSDQTNAKLVEENERRIREVFEERLENSRITSEYNDLIDLNNQLQSELSKANERIKELEDDIQGLYEANAGASL